MTATTNAFPQLFITMEMMMKNKYATEKEIHDYLELIMAKAVNAVIENVTHINEIEGIPWVGESKEIPWDQIEVSWKLHIDYEPEFAKENGLSNYVTPNISGERKWK